MRSIKLLIAFVFVFSLSATASALTTPEIITKEVKEENKQKRSRINIKYPQIKNSNTQNAKRLNKMLADKFMKKVADFKGNRDRMEVQSKTYGTPSIGYDLTIDFEVEMTGEDFVSISFGESTYLGGAHPAFRSYSVNYDLKKGREFELKDMFMKNFNYLKTISAFSIIKLSEKQGEKTDWIKRGASPKDENFDSWTVSRYGLKFIFDPYQVGPYAMGSFEVLMPYESLPIDIRSAWMKKIVGSISYARNEPKTVKDFYMAIPTEGVYANFYIDSNGRKITDPTELKKYRQSLIRVEDNANNYLKLEGAWEGWSEIALFKMKDGGNLIAKTSVGCGPGCSGIVSFFTYKNNHWKEVTDDVFPKIDKTQLKEKFRAKRLDTSEFSTDSYYLLPRKGTTLQLACNMCNDGDGKDFTLMKFIWNGERFSVHK